MQERPGHAEAVPHLFVAECREVAERGDAEPVEHRREVGVAEHTERQVREEVRRSPDGHEPHPFTGTHRTGPGGLVRRERGVGHPGPHRGGAVVGRDAGKGRRRRALTAVVPGRAAGAEREGARPQHLDPGDRSLDRTDDGLEGAVVEGVVVGLHEELGAPCLGLTHAEPPHDTLLTRRRGAREHEPLGGQGEGLLRRGATGPSRRDDRPVRAPEHDRPGRGWFGQCRPTRDRVGPDAPGGDHDATATGRSTRVSPEPTVGTGVAARTAPSAAGRSSSAVAGRTAPARPVAVTVARRSFRWPWP